MSTTYFNGISAVANQWRDSGNPRKVKATALKEFSSVVAQRYFNRVPGRVLRGRWLSCEGVEELIRVALGYIGRVFLILWGEAVDKKEEKRKRKADPGHQENEEFEAKRQATRTNSTLLLNHNVFLAMVAISSAAKAPLSKFMRWLENIRSSTASTKPMLPARTSLTSATHRCPCS